MNDPRTTAVDWGLPGRAKRGAEALPLRHVASWGLVGSLTYAGSQWVMLVVLAKLGSAETLGQFALGFAITAPVFLLTNLSLRDILATDAKTEHAFGDYLALRLVTTVAGLLVITGVAGVVGYRWETRAVILLVGVVKAVEAVSDVLYGLMQKHERMDLIAGSIAMRGVLSVLALASGVYLLGSVLWGLALVSAVWALVLAAYDLPGGARLLETGIAPRWVRVDLVRLWQLSWPLGVTAMLITLSAMIPRYFIERYEGEQELGAFVAIAYLAVIGGTVINALGQSASPRLARYYAEGDGASVRRLLAAVIAVAIVMGGTGVVVATVWGRQILTALYRPEYAERVDIFIAIMVAAGIGYVASLLGHVMTSARLFRVQMPLAGGVAAATVVSCAERIPANGLIGAAQVNIVTAVANLLGVAAVNLYALRYLGAARNRRAPLQKERV